MVLRRCAALTLLLAGAHTRELNPPALLVSQAGTFTNGSGHVSPPPRPPSPPRPPRPGLAPPRVKPLCADAIAHDVETQAETAAAATLSDKTCSVCSKELRGCPIGRNNHSKVLRVVKNSRYLVLWRDCRSACPPGHPSCDPDWPAMTRFDYTVDVPVTYCVLQLNAAATAVTVAVPIGVAVLLCMLAGLHRHRMRQRRAISPAMPPAEEATQALRIAPPEAPCGPPGWNVSALSQKERAALEQSLLDGRVQYSRPVLDIRTPCDDNFLGFLPWLFRVAWLLITRPCRWLACALTCRRSHFIGWAGTDSLWRDFIFRVCQVHSVIGVLAVHPLHPVRRPLRLIALACEVLFGLAVNWFILSGFGFHAWLRQNVLKPLAESDYIGCSNCSDYELTRVTTALVDNKRVINNMESLTASRQTAEVTLVVALFAFLLNLPWMWLQDVLLTGEGLPLSPARRAALRSVGPYLLVCVGLPSCIALFLVAFVRTAQPVLVLALYGINALLDFFAIDIGLIALTFLASYRQEVRAARTEGPGVVECTSPPGSWRPDRAAAATWI